MTTPAELLQWNTRPIEDLGGSQLYWSTVVDEHGRAKTTMTSKPCAFCSKAYGDGPKDIKIHMRSDIPGVTTCKPRPEWKERHAAVVAERKKRESETKAAALHQRMLEDAHSEGQQAAKPPKADPNQPTFKAKTTPADVNKQWARAVAKKALPLTFVDDHEVRLAILKTAECGHRFMNPKASRPRQQRRYGPAKEEKIPAGACHCG